MRGEDIDTRRRRAVYRATHRGTKEMDWTSAVTPLRCCRNWRGVRSIASNDCLNLPDPELHQWFHSRTRRGHRVQ